MVNPAVTSGAHITLDVWCRWTYSVRSVFSLAWLWLCTGNKHVCIPRM